MPPGTVECIDHYPAVVMRDRVGWFVYVMGEPFRHYCTGRSCAVETAKAMKG